MKKFISMMCLLLTFATLFCACNGEEPVETQPVTESVTATAPAEETTKAPAKKNTFIDVDGTLSATSKELSFMRLRQFTNGEYLHTYAQGGIIEGDYAYTCMVTPWNRKPYENVFRTCIVKRSLINGEIVAKSESLPLGVSNDATYVPYNNTIVVVDGLNANNLIQILDADTLKVKETLALKGGVQAIAYDELNERYITIKYDGDDKIKMYIYNKDFKLLKEISGTDGLERMDNKYGGKFNCQGIHTDGTYLYILEWHGGSKYAIDGSTIEREVETKLRIVEISTGKMVDRLDLGFQREPEYIGFRKGKFYICTNNISWTGMELYQVSITTEKN